MVQLIDCIMQKFYFEAVSSEGKKLTGTISANSQDEAHSKLKNGGMAVLSLKEYDESSVAAQGLKTFEFQAYNPQKKLVKGNIQAPDDFSAYKRLKDDYGFEVLSLVDATLPEAEKEILRQKGLNPDLDKKYNLQNKKAAAKEKKKTSPEEEIKLAVESHKREIEFMHAQIDEILTEIIPLVQTSMDVLNPVYRRQIEERINLLSRLRHSNSVDHLRNLTRKLIDTLRDDAIFIQEELASPEQKEKIQEHKKQFQMFSSKYEVNIAQGLEQIQLQIANIDPTALSHDLSKLEITTKIANPIYMMFVTLFGSMTLYWMVLSILNFLNINEAKTQFILSSNLLWFTTGVSCIVTFVYYYPLVVRRKMGGIEGLFYLMGCLFLVAIFTLQFPVIFHWVR